MSLPREPLFLARQNYRLRRIADAARGLPLIGIVLFMLPLLAAGQGHNDTVGWLIFIFCSWMVLIIVAAILSRGMARNRIEQSGDTQQQEAGHEGNP